MVASGVELRGVLCRSCGGCGSPTPGIERGRVWHIRVITRTGEWPAPQYAIFFPPTGDLTTMAFGAGQIRHQRTC